MSVREPFQFKKFSVTDDRSALKIGTDAVLLGSWLSMKRSKNILDIGTGCGVISLMLAQRTSAVIDAIDIHKGSIEDADVNFKNSPWKNRLSAKCISIQEFVRETNKNYDLIVCNPPYFSQSLKSPSALKSLSKHDQTLTQKELIDSATKLLDSNGIFCVILPYTSGMKFRETARQEGLFCTKQLTVIPKTGKLPNRVILEFSYHKPNECLESEIKIRNIDSSFTTAYIQLTNDYYLHLK